MDHKVAHGTVYARINAVQAALAKTGIAKSRQNRQQGYAFRGIDDVYAAVAPLLAEHGLVILPRVVSREVVERQTRSGGALFYSVVEVEFDLVSTHDGSTHTIRTVGEAMDSADKSTNKAMSAAMKYALLMLFTIPTDGDNDADATTYEVGTTKNATKPDGFDGWWMGAQAAAERGMTALRQHWANAPSAMRYYVGTVLRDEWEAVKKTADGVDALAAS